VSLDIKGLQPALRTLSPDQKRTVTPAVGGGYTLPRTTPHAR
jgi:hypothetical protein